MRLTEEQYLSLTDPTRAVGEFKRRGSPLRTSTRKARLFCCAVCRRVWDRLGLDAHRAAVEAAERAADGLVRVKDLRPFYEAARATPSPPFSADPASAAARPHAWPSASTACLYAAGLAAQGRNDAAARAAALNAELAAQCELMRDLLGNPFRRKADVPLSRPPGANTLRLAGAIYAGRSFADLPVLADALEDDGIAEADVLAHLRGGGEHAHGCWAVDLVLGLK